MTMQVGFICPKCGTSLAGWIAAPQAEHRCSCCGAVHTHSNGIFHFVGGDAYLDSFSFEWKVHARTFFSEELLRGTEATLRKLHLTPESVRGRLVLDVGCGAGRFSEALSRWGARVVAVELSEAIFVARDNLKDRQDITFVHADLFELPFPPGHFDVILAWGVLHHTPDTAAAFRAVARHLRPGGTMATYIYGKTKGSRRRMIDLYRKITTRLPKRVLYALCLVAGPMYYVYKIPLLGGLLRVLVPVSRHSTWRERVLETFDEYSPRYAWRHPFPEVHQWFVDAGMVDNRIYDPPIYAVGWLPAASSQAGPPAASG